MSKFTQLTNNINKSLSKKTRQIEGIYFTPKDIRSRMSEILQGMNLDPSTILEPSFGSGEFLNDMKDMYPKAELYGIEKNKEIFDQVANELEYNANILCMDFLDYVGNPVDLIIGNPPYFVTKIKNPSCMSGRGNIFVLFLYKCLTEHLVNGGVLAFVISTSFYNCIYYQKCRDYISNNCTIIHVEDLNNSFFDTIQSTCLIVLRKEKPKNDNFIYQVKYGIYINPHYLKLRQLSKDCFTLKDLGYSVKTGTIIWNEYKKNLHNENGKLLIYSSNITKENELTFDLLKGEKKQFIDTCVKPHESGPSILISRGYGNSYQFRYTIVNMDEYYVENHINMVFRSSGDVDIRDIITSLERPETKEFLTYFIGNGALSKNELESVFPIKFNP